MIQRLLIPQLVLFSTGAGMMMFQATGNADPIIPWWVAFLLETGLIGAGIYWLRRSMDIRLAQVEATQIEANKEMSLANAITQLATSQTEGWRAFTHTTQAERAQLTQVISGNTDSFTNAAKELSATTLNLSVLTATIDEMKVAADRNYDRLMLLFPKDEPVAEMVQRMILDAVREVCEEKRVTDEQPIVTLPDITPMPIEPQETLTTQEPGVGTEAA